MPELETNSSASYLKHLRRAEFISSIPNFAALPNGAGQEVAFAGRSNAGKSSVINCLCDNKKLARISKTPGRTRALNFFSLPTVQQPETYTPPQYLVDLPGYGFARISAQLETSDLISQYLMHREQLCALVLILDIRRQLTDTDRQLMHLCAQRNRPLLAVLNKADKCSRSEQMAALQSMQKLTSFVMLFSAVKKTGLDAVADWIAQQLQEATLAP
ncbi:MAG: ribosome biogenesis GTP-binding protein YihA/YsxC [Gammaproteobacteria bacterium]